jgi:hypothetical protein
METYKLIYRIASDIQNQARDLVCLEDAESPTWQIFPESIVKNRKPYIKRISREINGTYEKGFHTSCGVMIRRLIETCMIEAFEFKGLASIIKQKKSNDYMSAEEIRIELLKDPFGNLSRNARRALNDINIIELGHKCAHDRFFIARKQDIDGIISKVRILIEYLIHQSE